jgi:HlyD family secretion protein
MPARKGLYALVAVVLIAVGLLSWRLLAASAREPEGLLAVSGRIEGDESAVAAKSGGRIAEIRVREGDTVKAGDVLALLDDSQVRSREEQSRLAVTGAEAREQAARKQIAVLEEQLQQSQLQTDQAKADASGRVQQAEADLAAAEAELARQEAADQLAVFDREAYTKLAQSGAVSERQGRQAIATANQQAAAVAAAKRRVEAARGATLTARANIANGGIRSSQTVAVRQQIAEQQAEIASTSASAAQARAQLREAEADLRDLTVLAPFSGTVISRTAEPGEVIQPGTPIVTLVDLGKVYLRGFVPEGQIGGVTLGQPARVYLDSNQTQPIDAVVTRVDPETTFTPENTYFKDDRVRQVVGIKLLLKSASGFAKPGMPADGEILLHGSSWPDVRR